MGIFFYFKMIIKGYFCNVNRCKPKEWVGVRLQLHRMQGMYVLSNGFGSLGILDAHTQRMLEMFIPLSKRIGIYCPGNHNGHDGFDVEIKFYWS
jgi:exonuclease III